jgi:hypothetical protein
MRRAPTLPVLLLAVTVAAAGYLAVRSFELLGAPRLAGVQPVPQGHQEIAYLGPATSADTWERLVAAVRRLVEQWPEHHQDLPRLDAFLDHVFKERTTDVPELALWLGGRTDAKLWLRWYKLSSEMDASTWVDRLARRDRPPLAILGGENSDRALSLANTLQAYRGRWKGPDPVFLITTATADRYARADTVGDQPLSTPGTPRLMRVYPGRSFRFSFTNSRMAAVVMDFVQSHPEVWSHSPHAAAGPAALVGAGGLTALTLLACRDQLPPVYLYSLAWADDRYSKDLADRFSELFLEHFGRPPLAQAAGPRVFYDQVPYGVGDRDRPNPQEAWAIDRFFDHNPLLQGNRQLLVLPTGTDSARRVLRALANRAPVDIRNLVVLSGDSITFNSIFRDRDVAWNIEDMPLPLVFFSHRNPINYAAGFRTRADSADPAATTGTQDLLLYRDIIEAVTQAAYRAGGGLGDAEHLRAGLARLRWDAGRVRLGGEGGRFFDEDGDRSDHTGEHVVWLNPKRREGRVLPEATISVWRLGPGPQPDLAWRRVGEPLEVQYDWPTRSARGEAGGL